MVTVTNYKVKKMRKVNFWTTIQSNNRPKLPFFPSFGHLSIKLLLSSSLTLL